VCAFPKEGNVIAVDWFERLAYELSYLGYGLPQVVHQSGFSVAHVGAYLATGQDAVSVSISDLADIAWPSLAGSHMAAANSGGFAACSFNAGSCSGWAERDACGRKPLFFSVLPGLVLVSSVLAVLAAVASISDYLDEAAIDQFLQFGGLRDTGLTVFSGIRRVPAGSRLTIKSGRIVREDHLASATITPRRTTCPPSAEAAATLVRNLLTEAVARRFRLGRTVVALSGGLDSALVAAALPTRQGVVGHTFGYAAPPHSNEIELAIVTALHLGMETRVHLRDEAYLLDGASTLGAWTPEPFAGAFVALDRALEREIARDADLLLFGHGPDELLALPEAPQNAPAEAWPWLRRAAKRNGSPHQEDTSRPHERPPIPAALSLYFETLDPGFTRVPLAPAFPFLDASVALLLYQMPPALKRDKAVLRQAAATWLPNMIRLQPKMQPPRRRHALITSPVTLLGAALEAAPWLQDHVNTDALVAAFQTSGELLFPDDPRLHPIKLAAWALHRRSAVRLPNPPLVAIPMRAT
jgi:asparagine synthetase B (glutamine-hydrolysing)